MKPCHICEKIVRTQKSVECSQCKQSYCHFCIGKYFPERVATLLGKHENLSIPTLRVTECFACLKECKCFKCKSQENVVYTPTAINSSTVSPVIASLVSDDQLVPETGLFRGRKVSELPIYLQRIYLKKKVLYSKHETSCLSNDKNIPEQQNAEQPQEKMAIIIEERERKEDESAIQNNNEPAEGAKEDEGGENIQKEGMDEEQEQPQDYESEFPSRRAGHLQNQAENSAMNDADVEDQAQLQGQDLNNENEAPRDGSMGEEPAHNEQRRGGQDVEEPSDERNNRSSVQQPVQ